MVGDYIAPPPTLPKFFELVPVIVDAEVVRTGSPKVIRRAVLRTQELRALEVFKGSLSPGSLFKVVQPGGMAEDEAGTLHQGEYDMPLLEAGQRVLLFLGPQRDPAETYAIAFGPSGMFVRSATDPEKIVVPLGARAIQQFGGRSEVAADTLLSELRRLRDRR